MSAISKPVSNSGVIIDEKIFSRSSSRNNLSYVMEVEPIDTSDVTVRDVSDKVHEAVDFPHIPDCTASSQIDDTKSNLDQDDKRKEKETYYRYQRESISPQMSDEEWEDYMVTQKYIEDLRTSINEYLSDRKALAEQRKREKKTPNACCSIS